MIPASLTIEGIEIGLRRSDRARRLILKLDPLTGPVLTLPAKASLGEARLFLDRNKAWLFDRLDNEPKKVPFAADALIPILGVPHAIRHVPAARRGAWLEDGALLVSGAVDHLPRRVRDFLKAEAEKRVRPLAFDLSSRIGKTPTRITVRSLKSRWGSCSSAHDLSFSWRLILAPEPVLAYVVAHEVAHMAELNHSPAFWQVVGRLHPDFRAHRRWLKTNGTELFRYGG